MPHRVQTVAELRAIALGSLGPMTGNTFQGFKALAAEKAKGLGITRPALVLPIEFKPGVHYLSEIPYEPIEDEWEALVGDVGMCKVIPEVLIVDGDKYIFPI